MSKNTSKSSKIAQNQRVFAKDGLGIEVDRNVIRRVLAKYYLPENGGNSPSWLTFLGHMKNSLWNVDLFRCESTTLKSYWVLVVMDQFTRRIIGFAIHAGDVNGLILYRMFNKIVSGITPPKYLSSDNDPLLSITGGKRTCAFLTLTKSRRSPMFQCLTLSWSV